jgi:hypothetical protein
MTKLGVIVAVVVRPAPRGSFALVVLLQLALLLVTPWAVAGVSQSGDPPTLSPPASSAARSGGGGAATPTMEFAPEGAKVASLTVEAATGQAASLVLLSRDQPAFALQADKSGTFSIRQGDSDVLTVSATGDLVARTHMLAAGALSAASGVYVNDVMQWALVVDESFQSGQAGWEKVTNGKAAPTTQCGGGLFLLGGFEGLAQESVQKTFTGEQWAGVGVCVSE